ncbi:hypothetical protein DCS32_05265 [Dokdonia sp. Dokd-P16]|uniref:hypothetical protein n=2 Tax=unclassified Dokdonia TaxID=2615033 RepID=UPI000D548B49|nr:hypothetical protein [Dokdonia sp. Dokd-P16]AWH73580.1 hypothetical protein DCS32_05265 [Dokdonia sp. Dokd-P16]
MKKLILPLAVIFITMSSFTAADNGDCDGLAEWSYYSALYWGFSEEFATNAYADTFETCTYENGGTSAFTANVE